MAESRNGAAPAGLYLEVPHYWQLSEAWGLNEYDVRRICSLICLKTILDYKLGAEHHLAQIKEMTIANGGKAENGWLHSAEVATLKQFGLNAWRRNWSKPLADVVAWRADRYDRHQSRALVEQRYQEAACDTIDAKARTSIVASLERGNPVILSVAPEFSENRGPHQIVVHGYETSGEEDLLYITDPVIKDPTHQTCSEPWSRIAEFWTHRGIFVDDLR